MRTLQIPDAPLLPVVQVAQTLRTELGPMALKISFREQLAQIYLNGEVTLHRVDYRLELQFEQEPDGSFRMSERLLNRIGGFQPGTVAAFEAVRDALPAIERELRAFFAAQPELIARELLLDRQADLHYLATEINEDASTLALKLAALEQLEAESAGLAGRLPEPPADRSPRGRRSPLAA